MSKVKEWYELWDYSEMDWPENIISKLTGRWKIKIVNEKEYLFLEIKSFLFKSWVDSTFLELEKHSEIIFECKK